MNILQRSKWRFRISTAFLSLGFFCWLLEFRPFSWIPDQVAGFIQWAYGYPLVAIIFWTYAPVWPLIGAVSALAILIERRKQRNTVIQSLLEIIIGLAMSVSFPTY